MRIISMATFSRGARFTATTIGEKRTKTTFIFWRGFHMINFWSWSKVVKRVALAAAGTWYGKNHFVVNTDDSRSPGTNWACILIEILPRQYRSSAASVVAQLVHRYGGIRVFRRLLAQLQRVHPRLVREMLALSLSPSQTPLSGLSALMPGDALALTAVFVFFFF